MTTETRLLTLSTRVLDAQLAAYKAGDMDRYAKAGMVRRNIARRLRAIAIANPPILSVRQRFGSKLGSYRS